MNNNNNNNERRIADLELIQAAYPDEVVIHNDHEATIHLSHDAWVSLTFPRMGYPTTRGVEIQSYRSHDKHRIDCVVANIRTVAQHSIPEESGMQCCAIALEIWNQPLPPSQLSQSLQLPTQLQQLLPTQQQLQTVSWTSGPSITDRKSTFQAHACQIQTEAQIQNALQQLKQQNTRIQKAYHNIMAYRITETLPNGVKVLKHDNNDDGETAAGSRLAQLLEFRKEQGVLLVVSRWYGGIPLGPKRFAHITNTARQVLVICHDTVWTT